MDKDGIYEYPLLIAVPIVAETMDGALRDIDKSSKVADFLELRIDYLQNPDIEKLLRSSPVPKIITNRHPDEGGRYRGPEDRRIASLQEAIDLGAEYIDIEYNFYRKYFKREDPFRNKVIISHHNFSLTPDIEKLDQLYKTIIKKKCLDVVNSDIIKIATRARTFVDNWNSLDRVLMRKSEIISVCMGEFGIPSRIINPLYGSFLTYASMDENKTSAPGQITVKELKSIWRKIENRKFRKFKPEDLLCKIIKYCANGRKGKL